jgi:hypothetical protein
VKSGSWLKLASDGIDPSLGYGSESSGFHDIESSGGHEPESSGYDPE